MNASMKTAVIAFAVGAVAVILWGEIRYRQGRADMRAEIMAQTPVRDTAVTPVVGQPPADTMHGTPATPQTPRRRATLPVAGRTPDGGAYTPPAAADVPAGEYVDENGGTGMAVEYVDTLTDRRGGSHRLSFTYPSLAFDEIYTPGPDTVRTVTVTETRYIETEPPPFFLTGYAAYLGAGVSVGYGPVGVGCMWMNEQKPAPFISYTVRF